MKGLILYLIYASTVIAVVWAAATLLQ